ncbi:hypothetical protein N7456_013394 [Penicillium angulare]|uniref:Uncharacterized protein n=1 Tax=Penicillium angulare TaxID=116970 RepID=A0A9W9EG44_9EURO|nr:hypothetical protein N7456_013394 [Penicillium angulare]
MAPSDLRLVFPPSHDIYFTLEGISYSQPLRGSAVLTLSPFLHLGDIADLRVCLVRSVTSTSEDNTDSSNQFLNWLSRQTFRCAPSFDSQRPRSCAIIEDLIVPIPVHHQSHVGNHPDRGKIFNVPFSLPISFNIPGTTTTPLGNISYSLVAYVATSGGQVITTSDTLSLRRHIVPEREQIEHTRTYTRSKIVSEIRLEQNDSSNSQSNISVNIQVHLRNSVSAGGRPTELKCTAIRGVRWRVEEVTRLVNQQENVEELDSQFRSMQGRTSVCEIANGFQKGYWAASQNPLLGERSASGANDSCLQIALDIHLRQNNAKVPWTDLSCYNIDPSRLVPDPLPLPFHNTFSSTSTKPLAITVEHRLRLDFTMTEDVFDAPTMSLVDRKPMMVATNGSFPLYIFDICESALKEVCLEGNPPRYEEVPQAPPLYDPLV